MGDQQRIETLERLTTSGTADSFTWYGLALEYASFGRIDDALATFETLRADNADYVAMYLMCGTMLLDSGRAKEAREWLECGVLKARELSEKHALAELEEALNQVPPPPSLG
ncbi:MAG: tetratricopeptide repeat protein [Deltaproteobacteria bacterium]|nr:MAG: tetratricopeptide repeat protein [Deltaproteobacteria bacterium]